MHELAKSNELLAEIIQRNMDRALERVQETASDTWDDQNLEAVVAFEAMRAAEEERHNLRSMQAWLAVRIGQEQLYLAYPPTNEYPEGFGDLKEWLRAVGISGSTVYALNVLGMEVAPYLREHGYEVEQYLNSDRFPKLAEVIPRLRELVRGDDTDFTLDEIMEDVSQAQSRDDMRLKYKPDTGYIAKGSVNTLGNSRVLTILAEEESLSTLLNVLRRRVDWHNLSSVVEERDHEIILRLNKERDDAGNS